MQDAELFTEGIKPGKSQALFCHKLFHQVCTFSKFIKRDWWCRNSVLIHMRIPIWLMYTCLQSLSIIIAITISSLIPYHYHTLVTLKPLFPASPSSKYCQPHHHQTKLLFSSLNYSYYYHHKLLSPLSPPNYCHHHQNHGHLHHCHNIVANTDDFRCNKRSSSQQPLLDSSRLAITDVGNGQSQELYDYYPLQRKKYLVHY